MANLLSNYIGSFFNSLQANFLSKLILLIGSFATFFILVFCLDAPVTNYIQNIHSNWVESTARLIQFLFHTNIMLFILGSLFFGAKLTSNEKLQTESVQSIAWLLTSMSIGMFIKLCFLRERPYVSFCPYIFFAWSDLSWETYNNFFSTPSGHVMSAVCTYFLWPKKYIGFFVALTLLVSFCRIYSLMHWMSDIFLSWAICLLFVNKPKDSL